MTQPADNPFKLASLSKYPWNKRLLIRLADLSFYSVVRALGSTASFEIEGRENDDSVKNAGKVPIYTFWHDQIMLATYFYRNNGVAVMTSRSFDGEYIARFITRLGYGAIRGSSSRGGTPALLQMIRAMKAGHPVAFTIDGPRGPRHVAKRGPILLAKETGNAILPVSIEPKSSYRLNSWDRFQIPAPFTTGIVICGKPIYVAADADEIEMENKHQELQESLDSVYAESVRRRSL